MIIDNVVKNQYVKKIDVYDKTVYYTWNEDRIVIMRGDYLIGLFSTGYIKLIDGVLNIKSESSSLMNEYIKIDMDTFEEELLLHPLRTGHSFFQPFVSYDLARRIYGYDK